MQRIARTIVLLALLVCVVATTVAMASDLSFSLSSDNADNNTRGTTMFGCLTTTACEYCYTDNLFECAQCREGGELDGNGDCRMTPLYTQASDAMTTGVLAVCSLAVTAVAAVVA